MVAAVAQRSLLLIADISGYTRFMKMHRVSLAHAEVITGRLLRTIVDSTPLPLVEVEGDAAFFAAPVKQAKDDPAALSLAIHHRFHAELGRMIAANMCNCDGCLQSRNLKIKVVGHVGDVAEQAIGGREKPVGLDVIIVHRMLKNAVPVPEYLLMTDSLADRCEPQIRDRAETIEQDLEGLGPTTLRFVDLAELSPVAQADAPEPALRRRIGETVSVALRGFPLVAGLRRPRLNRDRAE
jgi:class 3 adenylate cyclase